MARFSTLDLKRVILDRFPVDFCRVVILLVIHRLSKNPTHPLLPSGFSTCHYFCGLVFCSCDLSSHHRWDIKESLWLTLFLYNIFLLNHYQDWMKMSLDLKECWNHCASSGTQASSLLLVIALLLLTADYEQPVCPAEEQPGWRFPPHYQQHLESFNPSWLYYITLALNNLLHYWDQ